MLSGLDCLSRKVSDGHVNVTSLRAAIEEVYHHYEDEASLTDIEIDDGEEYEGAVYCMLRFTHGLVDGSMMIRYEAGVDLGLVFVLYDGATCETWASIPVPEFMRSLSTLDEEDFFSDGNNGVPLDSDGKQLIEFMRQVGRELSVE